MTTTSTEMSSGPGTRLMKMEREGLYAQSRWAVPNTRLSAHQKAVQAPSCDGTSSLRMQPEQAAPHSPPPPQCPSPSARELDWKHDYMNAASAWTQLLPTCPAFCICLPDHHTLLASPLALNVISTVIVSALTDFALTNMLWEDEWVRSSPSLA